MASALLADRHNTQLDAPTAKSPGVAKVVVTGGFGAGKTTLIRAACTAGMLTTEEPIGVLFAQAQGWTPQQLARRHKTSTTAALDFARLDTRRRLHVFATPGRMSFWHIWATLCDRADGAIVVIDPDRLADGLAPIDFFETQQIPLVVAINHFQDAPQADTPSPRHSLNLPAHVPVIHADLRDTRWAVRIFVTVSALLAGAPVPVPHLQPR